MDIGSMYKTLHHYEVEGHDLVMNEVTGVVCIRKELEYYDIRVFQYLRKNKNKHIPQIYDYYEENGKLIIFEELIKGKTLKEYLSSRIFTKKEKLKILDSICDGLMFLHSFKPPIIHRDLKMTNIMITTDGLVKIIDYDAAKVYKPGHSIDTELLGTRGSAAPEQYGFAQSDKRTDVYALGILVKQMFPYDRSMGRIIKKATAMDPAHRYADVKRFKAALHGNDIPAFWVAPVSIIVFVYFLAFLVIFVGMYTGSLKVLSYESNQLTNGAVTAEQLEEIIDSPDYTNIDDFERDLNNGVDMTNVTVQFKSQGHHYRFYYRHNNWAGEHLNFISAEDNGIREGDIVTVRVCACDQSFGRSWFISYELLDIVRTEE